MRTRELTFTASRSAGEVSALLIEPADARALFVFAHGAGAGMRHTFMDRMSALLADHAIATLRYQFPYMEKGGRRPDPTPVLVSTVRAAVDLGRTVAGPLPLFAGGKSMGGRMTSSAAAAQPLPGVRGIAFLGFPLHPVNRPGVERATHLQDVRLPLLFVQGTRDALAALTLLEPIVEGLGGEAVMHVVDDADHGFHVRKRVTGRTDDDVLEEAAGVIARWMARLQGPARPGTPSPSSISP